MRIAINGFGRIGRMILRAYLENQTKGLTIVAINDLGSIDDSLHLLKYDSVHGRLRQKIEKQANFIQTDHAKIAIVSKANPKELPWSDLDIDIVLECSGQFNKWELAAHHIDAGAKKVLVSAPCDGADLTVVYGVNHHALTQDHVIVSNASCTTNCLAPIVHVLDQAFGIDIGHMTTIHSYTGDQRLVDSFHPDLRRARAAAQSMIPSSTGAAKAVGLVLPHLLGKLDGTAIRVPTPNVSVVDFKFLAHRPITLSTIHDALNTAANGPLAGILQTTSEPLVSCDFNHESASSIVDLSETQIVDNRLGRILSWYDNEWGFSCRMLDVARHMASLIKPKQNRVSHLLLGGFLLISGCVDQIQNSFGLKHYQADEFNICKNLPLEIPNTPKLPIPGSLGTESKMGSHLKTQTQKTLRIHHKTTDSSLENNVLKQAAHGEVPDDAIRNTLQKELEQTENPLGSKINRLATEIKKNWSSLTPETQNTHAD